MNIRRYKSLIRVGILEFLRFRLSTIVTMIGNFIYIIIVYFLWKAIYASSTSSTINGMTFYDTLIYLVLAAALFSFMDVRLVWQIGRDIQSGSIITEIIKPVNFMFYQIYKYAGKWIVLFFLTFLPTLITVFIMTRGTIQLGMNIVLFFFSTFLSLMINFLIDFFVATICMYTESIWGLNVMKEVVVAFLSGASVPIAFFPDFVLAIIMKLPFQAIYNTPIMLLLDAQMKVNERIEKLLLQVFWIIVILIGTNLFWKKSLKVITVNGG
ncbi:ABC transporter permease [[Clostridium] polysaccharolyticum]|uniref:ABC-2 type transport system permease protein n=1 Tax=[Clostridium] polysaccharolyticum TaxID=29364 RepID=A0A1I0G137_9FIRM|nr:ABC-2 family transporter protein [[Clostridium] polysaccharolyticum]SET64533.1 ABC-2 type transport system permease protein [[Clostridium] polysaccharolyticum]